MPRRRRAFAVNASQPRATINAAWCRLLPGLGPPVSADRQTRPLRELRPDQPRDQLSGDIGLPHQQILATAETGEPPNYRPPARPRSPQSAWAARTPCQQSCATGPPDSGRPGSATAANGDPKGAAASPGCIYIDPPDPEGRVRGAAVTGELTGQAVSVVFAVRPDDEVPAVRADPPSLGGQVLGQVHHVVV
jgi:hypothetical protein